MNELVVPPSPNWYNDSILVCTPEEHVVYASRRDIVIIHPALPSEAAEIRIIHNAHDERVNAVNANLVNWASPNRKLVSVGEDKYVKVWNFDNLACELEHHDYEENDSPIVSASFAGERVISVLENGSIIVWQLTDNKRRCLNNIFGMKVKIICMATCPHAVHLTAFGLTSGLVVLADLRQSGKIMYKMREHDHDITGLSWCPVPYNIYKTKSGMQVMNTIKKKKIVIKEPANKREKKEDNFARNDIKINLIEEISVDNKIYEDNSASANITANIETCGILRDNKNTSDKACLCAINNPSAEIVYPTRVKPIVDRKNPWGNVVFNDSDDHDEDQKLFKKITDIPVKPVDFLTECRFLQKKINNNTNSEVLDDKMFTKTSFDDNNEDQKILEKIKDVLVKPIDFSTECLVLQKTIGINTNSEILDDIIFTKAPFIGTELQAETKEAEDFDNIVEASKLTVLKEAEFCNTITEVSKSTNMHENMSKLTERVENETEKAKNEAVKTEKTKNESKTTILDLSLNTGECKDFLLASACRSGTICLWSAGTGHLQIKLPKNPKANNKRKDNRQNWISLSWAQPSLIISSSISHELLKWDLLPQPNNENYQIKSALIHADHKKHIFAIAVPFRVFENPESEDWRNNTDLCVWTSSHDRWLLCTKLSTRCNNACYSTFGGNVTCMAVSRLDPNKVAFAVGDGTIHIWDLSRPHKNNIITNVLHDRAHTKVSCIDWHPTRENVFTFCTTDGRVGEYNLLNKSKIVTIYSNYHRSTVHKVQWGPLPNNDSQVKLDVYSCSLGELIVHDSFKPNIEPYQLAIFDEEFVTNFTWKTDFTLLAVGSRNGSIKILNSQFQLVQTLYMQKKGVRCLEWHPLTCETKSSQFTNHLAVSTKENDIYIYNLNDNNLIQPIILSGHKNSVKNLSWCQIINLRLVSSDEDGISIVWDVKTQTKLSIFAHNNDNNPSVIWSPFDADLIISGGKILQIFRITKNPPVLTTTYKKLDNKFKNVIKLGSNTTKKVYKARDKRNILSLTHKSLSNTENASAFCRTLLRDKTKSNLGKEMDSSDSEEFQDANNDAENYLEHSIDPVKLFGNRRDVIAILDLEQKHHLENKRFYNHGLIGLWKGDLSGTIKAAIESNNITPWIITMAPMVSHKVWLEVCEKYGKILEEKEDYIEASCYYLICHKIMEAINVLCKGQCFKEAFILAKLRLSEENELMAKILESWLRYNVDNGNYEIVAMICIHMDRYSEAAEVLNKRSKLDTLKLAADLARRCTDKDLLNTIISKVNALEENKRIQGERSEINICESRLQALLLKQQNNQ